MVIGMLTMVGCQKAEQGKVFRIYAWNEEFKGFFEKYYTVPEGITVEWVINPSDNSVYQQKLDEALLNQANASADDKIDMFLAEADYIGKYVDSEYTMDVTSFGYKNVDTMYEYTIKAASDSKGVCKGVSFLSLFSTHNAVGLAHGVVRFLYFSRLDRDLLP